MKDYLISQRRIHAEDLEEQAEFSKCEYENRDICYADHLKWKYTENPEGGAAAVLLHHGDRLVGRIAFYPHRFESVRGTVRLLILVDLLIHPDYRRLSNLMLLVDGVKAAAAGGEEAGILILPNREAIPIYRTLMRLPSPVRLRLTLFPIRAGCLIEKQLGIKLPGLRQVLNGISRALAAILRRGLSGLQVREVWPTHAEWDTLQQGLRRTTYLAGGRDYGFFRWRFLEPRSPKYRSYFLYSDGALCGYAILRSVEFAGFRAMVLIDSNVANTKAGTSAKYCRVITGLLLLEGLRQGVDLVLAAYNNACPTRAIARAWPMVSLPEALQPQEMPVFIHSISPDMPAADEWRQAHITFGDFDIF